MFPLWFANVIIFIFVWLFIVKTENIFHNCDYVTKNTWSQPWIQLERLMLKLKPQFLVSWCKQLTHWKRPCCLERWKAEGEECIKGLDGWLASLMQWTWTLANSRRWWGTGKPGMLWSMGSQSRTWLSDWTTTTKITGFCKF